MTSNEPASADQVSYRLRLFVAGSTSRSLRAIENVRWICNARLDGRVDLEVIDIYQQPKLTEQYRVMVAPTLIRLLPLPIRRFTGDLSDLDRLLNDLGLAPTDPPENP